MDPNVLLLCIAVLFILLLLTILLLVSYSGLFHTIQIGAGPPPVTNLKVVYKYGKGSYKEAGPVFSDVTSIAPRHKCFGVYYDDPTEVADEDLQWAVGCILAEGEETPESALIETFREKGYRTFHFPAVSYVVHANFPCRTQLSVLLGIYRVYPELSAYVKNNRLCAHPWVEIYDGSTIHYMAPLARQSDFYVPETQSDHQSKSQTTSDAGQGDQSIDGDKNAATKVKPCVMSGAGDASNDAAIVTNSKKDVVPPPGDDVCVPDISQDISGVDESKNIKMKVLEIKLEKLKTEDTAVAAGDNAKKTEHSSSPVLRSSVVTDSQGQRGSRSRGTSEGFLLHKGKREHHARGSKSASEPKDKTHVQDTIVTSTTADAVFSDSDTLTDGDGSDNMSVSDRSSVLSSMRSGSEISAFSIGSSQLSSCAEIDDFPPSPDVSSHLLDLSSDSDVEISPEKLSVSKSTPISILSET